MNLFRFASVPLAAVVAFAALLSGKGALAAEEYKAGAITVIHPWSRATPAGAPVAAGYLTLRNDGTTPDRLVAVSAAIASKGEIHEMSVSADGVMSMRALSDGLEIPAAGEVALEPGSFHLMFLGLSAPAVKGTTFKGTLTFEHAGSVDVEYAVGGIGGTGDHDGHAVNMDGGG